MSDSAFKSLEEIRARMAEAFGKKVCKMELTVDEIIAVKLVVENFIQKTDDGELLNLLKLVPMRIQQALDTVKP